MTSPAAKMSAATTAIPIAGVWLFLLLHFSHFVLLQDEK